MELFIYKVYERYHFAAEFVYENLFNIFNADDALWIHSTMNMKGGKEFFKYPSFLHSGDMISYLLLYSFFVRFDQELLSSTLASNQVSYFLAWNG